MQVYDVNVEPNCFINKLVSSLTSDDLYQKNINRLLGTNEKENINKANLITHTISNIQIYNDNIHPLFLAKDIAILTGISHISYLIRKFDNNEVEKGYITQNGKVKKVMFLSKNGVIRCCFHSKSPFAQLFKNFIYEISNYMIENETEKIKKIAEELQVKNSKLVSDGLNDLSNKIIELENKYKYELERNDKINTLFDNECHKNKILESENTIIQVDSSYQTMIIEQLKLEKKKYEEKIREMNNIDNETQDYSIDKELKLIKEKLMIPMFIYILSPDYLEKLVKINDNDNYTRLNYNKIYEYIDTIDHEELLYYYISFARKIDKPKLKLVNTYYVFDKKHYNNTISNLAKETHNITFKKMTLYHTSLEEIKNITITEQEKILQHLI
jgi:hypothetical protein